MQEELRLGKSGCAADCDSLANTGRVLIGGVGYRWMKDASFGLVAVDELARQAWPHEFEIVDLGYGALFVAQDLATAASPYRRMILIAGTARERPPGQVTRYRWIRTEITHEELQARIQEAGAGVIDLDHLLPIVDHFAGLPEDVQIIEFEPVDAGYGEPLSPQGRAVLEQVLDEIRRELLGPSGGRGRPS